MTTHNYNEIAALMREFLRTHSAASMTAPDDGNAINRLRNILDHIVTANNMVQQQKEQK